MEKTKDITENKKGLSVFRQLVEKKCEVKRHLANGGSLTDLQGKNHNFVQPV